MGRGIGKVGIFIVVASGVLALSGAASRPIYDESADAQRQIRMAMAEASRTGKNIVLDFGANWCPDCRALDAEMRKPELSSLIAKAFVIVPIDVGRMNKNLDLARRYHIPLEKGIPALAVLDARGRLLYAQQNGQFEDARHLGYESIREFFLRWVPKR
jgi:thioredoxin 1